MPDVLVSPWEQRIRRAEELTAQYPYAAEPLRFYQQLVRFQEGMQESLRATLTDLGRPREEDVFPLRALLREEHRDLLLPRFPEFLDHVRRTGSPALADAAAALRSVPEDRWEALLEAYWFQDTGGESDDSEVMAIDFFPKAFLQPYASLLAGGLRGDGEEAEIDWKVAEGIAACPMCGARAQVSVLRPEGHGSSRSLVCSLCATEWRFKRVRCVACGEEEFERLVFLTTEEFRHVRINACDTCHTYFKEVDLVKELAAVPVVDEIATMPLDVVAVERGYRKLELNLIGM